MIIGGVFAVAMLATPLLATGAGASPTNANPNASCISAIANGNDYFGGTHGIGQFHDEGHPFGQAILETVQTKVSDCQ
jgi:hypothetical protein